MKLFFDLNFASIKDCIVHFSHHFERKSLAKVSQLSERLENILNIKLMKLKASKLCGWEEVYRWKSKIYSQNHLKSQRPKVVATAQILWEA